MGNDYLVVLTTGGYYRLDQANRDKVLEGLDQGVELVEVTDIKGNLVILLTKYVVALVDESGQK